MLLWLQQSIPCKFPTSKFESRHLFLFLFCFFVMLCYPGYSSPGTPTANRFVSLNPRDPTFLHQQQVRFHPLQHSAHLFILSFHPFPRLHPFYQIPALYKIQKHTVTDF